MKGRRLFLMIQTLLWVLLAAALCLSALGMFREGLDARRAGDAEMPFYTRERVETALWRLAPLFAACLGMAVLGSVLGIREEEKNEAAPPKAAPKSTGLRAVRLALLALALAMIAYGAIAGGARDVWYKAAKICAECVGLG